MTAILDPTSPEPVVPPDPAPSGAFESRLPTQEKQRWACVTPEGPRTARGGHVNGSPTLCPIFETPLFVYGQSRPVACPTCGGLGVRTAYDGEA
jgi:hypothetical protein